MILIYSYIYSDSSEEESQIKIQDIVINQDQQIYTNITDQDTVQNKSISMKINFSLATEEDKKLINIIKESDNIFMIHFKDAAKAAKDENRKSLEIIGININEHSQNYLNTSNNINVSPQFNILLNEYKQSLENYKDAGRLITSGAVAPKYNGLMNSINYMKEGKRHMNIAMNLISE